MKQVLSRWFNEKNLNGLAIIIILLGILLRAIFYLQNRCLFIDEANVARNIYERSFAGLTHPLSYEQYAPPVFLWIVKCCTLLFGYGELAFRLYPFICGIAALLLMLQVLRRFTNYTAMWYPLFIMATGFIYIRYSAEVKQYMPDVVVALSLLLLSLNIDVLKTTRLRFFTVWCLAGSLAIWVSMPSVFTLAGVGAYYFYLLLQQRVYNKTGVLLFVAAIWLVQFGLYYLFILKPQIQSDYLQNFHKDFFLYGLPTTTAEVDHDAEVCNQVLTALGGKLGICIAFHIITIITGVVFLVRTNKAKSILLLVPVVALITAAATHQYALTPRLILFIMPVLLLLVAIGLQALLQIRFLPLRFVIVVAGIICLAEFGTFSLFYKRMDSEQITEDLSFLMQQKITARQLYVYHLATPAYLYYTTIHPGKEKWSSLANANLLRWGISYDSLGRSFSGRSALLYGWEDGDLIAGQRAAIEKHHKQEAENKVVGGQVFIYQ